MPKLAARGAAGSGEQEGQKAQLVQLAQRQAPRSAHAAVRPAAGATPPAAGPTPRATRPVEPLPTARVRQVPVAVHAHSRSGGAARAARLPARGPGQRAPGKAAQVQRPWRARAAPLPQPRRAAPAPARCAPRPRRASRIATHATSCARTPSPGIRLEPCIERAHAGADPPDRCPPPGCRARFRCRSRCAGRTRPRSRPGRARSPRMRSRQPQSLLRPPGPTSATAHGPPAPSRRPPAARTTRCAKSTPVSVRPLQAWLNSAWHARLFDAPLRARARWLVFSRSPASLIQVTQAPGLSGFPATRRR